MENALQRYVLGFMFDENLEKVALIRKNRPEWQKGKLNGIGGKVEEDETIIDAMLREFKEETGMGYLDWKQFHIMIGAGFEVRSFVARGDVFWIVSMEDE